MSHRVSTPTGELQVAWNQALVDEIDAVVAEEMPKGENKWKDGYVWTKHAAWLLGNVILRHYPELRDYDGKQGRPKKGETGEGGVTFTSVATATGYDKNTIKKWTETAKAGGLTEETFTAYIEPIAGLAWDKVIGEYDQDALPPPDVPLPEGKYQVIYADPPWNYTSGDQHTDTSQETVLSDHYQSMTIDELCGVPVDDLAYDDCVLFLWATSPLLEEVYDIIRAWGFDYKTSMVWDKVRHNVGNYVSVRHELLLICARGTPPKVSKLVDSVYTEERTEHSRKPDYFRSLIDELYPEGKRIELFARGELPTHWDAWGDQAE